MTNQVLSAEPRAGDVPPTGAPERPRKPTSATLFFQSLGSYLKASAWPDEKFVCGWCHQAFTPEAYSEHRQALNCTAEKQCFDEAVEVLKVKQQQARHAQRFLPCPYQRPR